MAAPQTHLDYSLTGVNAGLAVEKGLAEADWYQCPVPRDTLRALLERRDRPALLHTALWLGLILVSGFATYRLRGSWWMLCPYAIYSVLYASTSDSRWHESGHGTAFKTDWMNDALYELSSFMVMRESTIWRWSHNRHHSDTIIVGRDPEIAVPRPVNIVSVVLSFFNAVNYGKYFQRIVMHAFGSIAEDEKTFLPASEFSKVFFKARIYLAVYIASLALALTTNSILPLLFVGLTNVFGTWLLVVYGLTQHAGLAENVLDHRLNCRTVHMNPIHRFLYWNMNYHVEHHMFPLVPYHALPRLHAMVRDDCPEPYQGLWSAWREIVPALIRQMSDPAYHVKRRLPALKERAPQINFSTPATADAEGWVATGDAAALQPADVMRFDYERNTFAICRNADGRVFAMDGMCTHGNMHLAEGLVIGDTIECSKHNGRFRLEDGCPARAPICRGVATYPVEERSGVLYLNMLQSSGCGARRPKTFQLRVISNVSVATFIKELVFECADPEERFTFTPGDYVQIAIPAYGEIRFRDFDVMEPYAAIWRQQHVFDLVAHNTKEEIWNNYSLASNGEKERTLRFNVRIATPPPGQECAPGAGSSYMFSLRTGDLVTARGPFGDFHAKPTSREMVYIGGGAGMAPMRAHLSHLLESEKSARRISYWYGARSRQEVFYEDYFQSLADAHGNFRFHVALSSPLPDDRWTGHEGFIHEVVLEQYLRQHRDPKLPEYYLCGPPMMIKACLKMLREIGVPPQQIAYDEF